MSQGHTFSDNISTNMYLFEFNNQRNKPIKNSVVTLDIDYIIMCRYNIIVQKLLFVRNNL